VDVKRCHSCQAATLSCLNIKHATCHGVDAGEAPTVICKQSILFTMFVFQRTYIKLRIAIRFERVISAIFDNQKYEHSTF